MDNIEKQYEYLETRIDVKFAWILFLIRFNYVYFDEYKLTVLKERIKGIVLNDVTTTPDNIDSKINDLLEAFSLTELADCYSLENDKINNISDAVYLRREIFELSSYIPENHRLKNIFNLLRKKDLSFSFSLEGKERVMDYYYELIRSHYNEKAVDELYIFDVLNDLMFVVLMLENEREEDYSYLTDLIKQIIENYKVNFEINSRDILISVIEEIKYLLNKKNKKLVITEE